MGQTEQQKTTAYYIFCINGISALLAFLWSAADTFLSNALPHIAWLDVADGYSMIYILLFAISFLLGDSDMNPVNLLGEVLFALRLPEWLRCSKWHEVVCLIFGAVLWWAPAITYSWLGENQIGITLLLCYIVVWILFFRALHVAQTKEPVAINNIEEQKNQQSHVYAILIFAGLICGIAVMMLLLRGVYILFAPEYKLAEVREPHTVAIVGAVGFLLILFIGFLYSRHTRKIHAALEKIQLEHQVEQNQLYIDLLTQKYHTLQQYQHDFKKHLAYIQHLAEQNQPAQITTYIASVYDDLQSGTLQKLTGNQTLDVLLSDKLQAAQNHAVQFHIDYHPDVQLEQIAPPDLCILLGNLLDNALAAAAKSEQRQLVCQFRMKNEYYAVIHITNSCDIAPLMADSIPQTSQNDTQHGYGVQNAIRCAQKYGGDCQFHYDAEAKQFQVSVLLNIITR